MVFRWQAPLIDRVVPYGMYRYGIGQISEKSFYDGDVWVSIASLNSDSCFASVNAVLYVISYNAASCYNSTGL